MNDNDPQSPQAPLPEVVIPKENAVFWMDAHGRWHNRHGRFEHKRIIDHFNRSIRYDQGGYYVTQERDGIREKVYFVYTGTPLFVVQIIPKDPIELMLNTGKILVMDPGQLFTHADQLYQRKGQEYIKFSDRALVALAPYLTETPAGLSLQLDEQLFPIPDRPNIT